MAHSGHWPTIMLSTFRPLPAEFVRSMRILAVLLALALQGCGPASTQTLERPSPEALSESLSNATRELCLRHVIDGLPERSLTQEPGISEVHYNIHGRDVTRYRLDLPGAPEVTFLQGDHCRVQIHHDPDSDLVAVFDDLTRDWNFVGRPTSEYHQSQGPDVLVIDAGDRFGDDGLRGRTICVHGQRTASVQIAASSGVLRWAPGDETRGTPNLYIDVESDLRPENCPRQAGDAG